MLSKMSKENLEMLSYAKIAELYLKENKKPMNTADLFKEVCKLLELSDEEYQERIGDFFESLTTSKEFILLNDGNWDLRANHSVKIDIDDIVANNFLMNVEGKYLCSEDCKGLCQHCGADLNEGDCGCSQENIDPRWAALVDIMEKDK